MSGIKVFFTVLSSFVLLAALGILGGKALSSYRAGFLEDFLPRLEGRGRKIQEIDLSVPSRGRGIPGTVVLPSDNGLVPLVVFIHSYGGNRNEGGLYTEIARSLGEKGIASIRMDLPGAGDSEESFLQRTHRNIAVDIVNSTNYMIQNYPILTQRIGILGLGGASRVASLLGSMGDYYRAMALLFPESGNAVEFFGNPSLATRLEEEAVKRGFVNYTSPVGQNYQISRQFIEELNLYQTEEYIRSYRGALFLGAYRQGSGLNAARRIAQGAEETQSTKFLILQGPQLKKGLVEELVQHFRQQL